MDYEVCGIEVAIGSGATLEVEVISGRTVFDDEHANAANAAADAVVRVENLGDAALRFGDRLFVLVGDRADRPGPLGRGVVTDPKGRILSLGMPLSRGGR